MGRRRTDVGTSDFPSTLLLPYYFKEVISHNMMITAITWFRIAHVINKLESAAVLIIEEISPASLRSPEDSDSGGDC